MLSLFFVDVRFRILLFVILRARGREGRFLMYERRRLEVRFVRAGARRVVRVDFLRNIVPLRLTKDSAERGMGVAL